MLSLHFTWPHLAPVSIIPALPFQISMSGCWSRNTNTVGAPRRVSTGPTLTCTNARGYTCSTRTDPPKRTNTHFPFPHTGFSVPLPVEGKSHPSYRVHGAKDYSHFSQSRPNCTGWLSYLGDSCGFLFAYKWQKSPSQFSFSLTQRKWWECHR